MTDDEIDRLVDLILEVAQLRADVDFTRAHANLLNTLDALVTGDVPRFALPVRSMTRRVHRHFPAAARPPAVPFGWTARKSWNVHAWDVGPWWYLRGRELVDQTRRAFYSLMLYKLKWATLEQDGGYFHDVKWRFLEETRWPE